MRLVVAVLTFRRPAELARMLTSVTAQAAALQPPAEVLVVDNDPTGDPTSDPTSDPTGGARGIAGAAGARWVGEPTPGIAAARNRALDETAGADALVFVDDDEQPHPGWLAALVATWQASSAGAVTGPVEPIFDVPPDAWVLASRRFTRRRLPTGTVLPAAASNNLLLDLAAVRRLGLRFDDSFGLTGGEDTMFTRELAARGASIVWCDDAVVDEYVPAERLTHRWVLRREFRSGTSWSAMALLRAGDRRRGLVRTGLLARGTIRAAGGAARWLRGAVTGDVGHRARGACLAAANAGLVAGAVGHRYREYRR